MKKLFSLPRLKEYFLLGLITILPIVLTLSVLKSIVHFLDEKFYAFIPGVNSPKDLFGVDLPGLGILLTAVVVLLAGLLAKTITGKVFKDVIERWLSRVPFVRGLYKTSKQISGVFFSAEPSAFKKVVFVPFPNPGVRCMGFWVNEWDADHSYVFVPTAPNPTGGYILLYPNKDISETAIEVQDAIQFLISGGAAMPANLGPKPKGKEDGR